jgi:hypothetical protein
MDVSNNMGQGSVKEKCYKWGCHKRGCSKQGRLKQGAGVLKQGCSKQGVMETYFYPFYFTCKVKSPFIQAKSHATGVFPSGNTDSQLEILLHLQRKFITLFYAT